MILNSAIKYVRSKLYSITKFSGRGQVHQLAVTFRTPTRAKKKERQLIRHKPYRVILSNKH